MIKKAGTVSLFAFNKGLSKHTAPFDAIIYTLDGLAEVTISSKRINLKKGDILKMPANEPHALGAIEQQDFSNYDQKIKFSIFTLVNIFVKKN